MLPDKFKTARLTLRPIAPADANAMFACYAQDPSTKASRAGGFSPEPRDCLSDALTP